MGGRGLLGVVQAFVENHSGRSVSAGQEAQRARAAGQVGERTLAIRRSIDPSAVRWCLGGWPLPERGRSPSAPVPTSATNVVGPLGFQVAVEDERRGEADLSFRAGIT